MVGIFFLMPVSLLPLRGSDRIPEFSIVSHSKPYYVVKCCRHPNRGIMNARLMLAVAEGMDDIPDAEFRLNGIDHNNGAELAPSRHLTPPPFG
jgi:hypothetical protein